MKGLVLVLLLVFSAPAALADKLTDAADAAIAAVKSGDDAALRALASGSNPDPWYIADELCRRGAFDAAAVLTKAGSGGYTEKLPAYVAAQRKRTRNTAADDALAKGRAALSARDFAAALEAVKDLKVDTGDLTGIRAGFLRATALGRLRRPKERYAALIKAVDAAEKIGWVRRVLSGLFDASFHDYRRGNFSRAAECLIRATSAARAAGDESSVCRFLSLTGLVMIQQADFDRAADFLDRALTLARKLENTTEIGNALNRQGIMYRRRGRLRDALAVYQEALAVAKSTGNDTLIGACLTNVGLVQEDLGDPQAALVALRRALEIYEKLNRKDDLANTLGNIGVLRKNMGDYDEALLMQERALAIYQKTGHRRGALRTLGNLGVVHKRRGDFTKALEIQKEVLRLAQLAKNRNQISGALHNLGVVYKNLAEYESALQCFEEARTMQVAMGLRPDEAGNLLNQGLVHELLGDYSQALDLLEQSLSIYREIEALPGVATCLTNMGNIYRLLGDFDRADGLMKEALGLLQSQKDRSGEASALAALASNRSDQGKVEAALEMFERVLQIRESLGEKDQVAVAHSLVGTACGNLGRDEEALGHFRKTLAIASEIGARNLAIHAQLDLGRSNWRLGRYSDARGSFSRAVDLAAECGSQVQEVQGLRGLARVALKEGRTAEVIAYADRAIALLDVLVTGLADEQGAFFRDRNSRLYEVGALAGVARKDPSEVFRYLEAGRAGVLLQALGGRDRLRAAVLPPELVEEEAKARSAESVALWRFQRALSQGNRAELRDRRAKLDAARARVKASVERIQREARTQADLLYPEPVGIEAVQAALRPDEAFISYGLLRTDALALVLTEKEARIVPLAAPRTIQAALFDAADPAVDVPRRVDALRKLVVEPLRLPPGAKRILVSPDGALSYVPFTLLAQDKEVTFVPSAATWTLLREDRKRRGKGVLALADPARTESRLAPLSEARAEAKAIGDVLLIGKDATERRLADEIVKRGRWRAIHLACHGFVDPESPARAWLALAGEEGSSGDLTCLEVYRMSIPADLVTVSACETAKGKIYRAEGVVGFTRAFLFAGAPRVLVSLWKVDDEATKVLMVKFYELWKSGDVSAAAALRQAQRHVAAQERWKHPRYWAAWQLWGVPD